MTFEELIMEKALIIKALECCSNGTCRECPRFETYPCQVPLMRDALSLINELTEENERLHASCTELAQNLHECKPDTASQMQVRLALHFGTYTDKDQVRISEVFRILDQIAKEILGGD